MGANVGQEAATYQEPWSRLWILNLEAYMIHDHIIYVCDLLYLDVFGIFFLKWSYSEDVQRILLLAPALLNSCLTGVACSHVPMFPCFRLLQTASGF